MSLPRSYSTTGELQEIRFDTDTLKVREGTEAVIRIPDKWEKRIHFRRLMAPWNKCVHAAARFESGGELAVAKAVDRSASTDWWARNDAPRLQLTTPAGRYFPDLVVSCDVDGSHRIVMIGVKGDHLWESSDTSEARVKAVAASDFARAASESGVVVLEHWLVLDSDAQGAQTIEALRDLVVAKGSYLHGRTAE